MLQSFAKKTHDTLISVLLAVFLSLPLWFIHFIIHASPSGAGPQSPFASASTPLLMSLAGGAVFVLCMFLSLKTENRSLFVILFSVSFVLYATLAVVLGIFYHRDYFTISFQLVFIYYVLFLLKIDSFRSGLGNMLLYQGLFIFSLILAVIFLFWISLMGYAIATREEPRWIESLLYNIYNIMLTLILIWAAFQVKLKQYARVEITDSSVIIDGQYDLSKKFGRIELDIVKLFLTRVNRPVTCSEMLEYLKRHNDFYKHKETTCGECIEKDYKATSCGYYKNFYNRVLEIKKQLELFEVGTIISPENKLAIKQSGWKFRAFVNVRIVPHP
jgi:hypothetical protein